MFSKIDKFVSDHKTEILFGSSVVCAAVALYIARNKPSIVAVDFLTNSALKDVVLDPASDVMIIVNNEPYLIEITQEIIDMIANV